MTTIKHPPGGYATRAPTEQIMTDAQNNNMYLVNNGITIEIYTQMNGDVKKRYVGTVDLRTRILTVKRERGKHIHRKTNSYGFSFHILQNGKTFDRVQIIDDFGTYVVPVTTIMTEGKILNFAKAGFEKQIFLPITVIQNHKTKNII